MTVQQHQRRRRRVLATAIAWSLTVLLVAVGWWLVRPGRAVHEALGVSVPQGCRQLHEEHARTGAAFAAVYLTSTLTVNEAMDRFRAVATPSGRDARRLVLPDGTEIVIAPPQDVPATRMSPIQPVSRGVPLGTRSWIVISKGTPPASTWAVSVPPVGES